MTERLTDAELRVAIDSPGLSDSGQLSKWVRWLDRCPFAGCAFAGDHFHDEQSGPLACAGVKVEGIDHYLGGGATPDAAAILGVHPCYRSAVVIVGES